jgi:hypothetical protein
MRVRVLDRNGNHLPGVTLEYFWADNHACIEVRDLEPNISIPAGVKEVSFLGTYPGAEPVKSRALATDPEAILRFDVRRPVEIPIWLLAAAGILFAITIGLAFINQGIALFAFGVIFITAMLVLALVIPHPTPIQYLVIRIVLALAGAGIAGLLTGFIDVVIPGLDPNARPLVAAGGALAVFVIIYFKSPAALVAKPPGET